MGWKVLTFAIAGPVVVALSALAWAGQAHGAASPCTGGTSARATMAPISPVVADSNAGDRRPYSAERADMNDRPAQVHWGLRPAAPRGTAAWPGQPSDRRVFETERILGAPLKIMEAR